MMTRRGDSSRASPFAEMENLKNVKMPSGGTAAAGTLARVLLLGGAAVVGAANSLFNVEGGHRAIVFNRLTGIKETVLLKRCLSRAPA